MITTLGQGRLAARQWKINSARISRITYAGFAGPQASTEKPLSPSRLHSVMTITGSAIRFQWHKDSAVLAPRVRGFNSGFAQLVDVVLRLLDHPRYPEAWPYVHLIKRGKAMTKTGGSIRFDRMRSDTSMDSERSALGDYRDNQDAW